MAYQTLTSPSKAVFTVVTKSYLAQARVLAKELHSRHPEMPFYMFLADRPDGYFKPEQEPFTVIPLDDFFPSELMLTLPGYYTAYEFCNALRPFAHLHLANKIRAERWLYMDSDIFVCGGFDSLFEELNDCSILLTGHILKPGALSISEKLELNLLNAGIYNSGFIGLKNTPATMSFLPWWKERLLWNCLSGQPGLEVDQSWLNFAPLLFAEVKILKRPEVNVAYFNLHERELELDTDRDVRVAGTTIPFLHFSGWDWRDPNKITKHEHASPILGNPAKAWNHLCSAYLQRLLDESVQTTAAWPYSFAKSSDGQDITPPMRRKFLTYCRNHAGQPLEFNIFSNPELFRDRVPAPPPPPDPISLMAATWIWGGALLRAIGLRK